MVQAVAACRSPRGQTDQIGVSSELDKVPLGQVSLRVLRDSPVSIFLPMLCTVTCVKHAIPIWQLTASANIILLENGYLEVQEKEKYGER
jgi:hypothetical protein